MITVAAPFKAQLRCLQRVEAMFPEKLCGAKTHLLLATKKRAATKANNPKHNSCTPRPILRIFLPLSAASDISLFSSGVGTWFESGSEPATLPTPAT